MNFMLEMPGNGKVYFNLLILCVVFSQVIATPEENFDAEKASDLQIRKKRVINESPESRRSVSITKFPFLVNIRKVRKTICSGSIVSPHVVLTIPHCVEDDLLLYHVFSGSEKTSGTGGKNHNVISKLNHPRYRANQFENALSLITIEPSVNRAYTEEIELQAGPTMPGVRGVVAGWGCNRVTANGRGYPEKLQAISVRVINIPNCQFAYRNYTSIPAPIRESEICTLDVYGQQRCSDGDTGAPLVLFRHLAGLYIWSADAVGKPDVFVSLDHPDTHLWVSENIRNVESHLLNNNRFNRVVSQLDPHHLPYPHLPINLPANHHHGHV